MAGSQRSLLALVTNLPQHVQPIVALTAEGPVADAFRAAGVTVCVHPVEGHLAQYGKAALRWSLATKLRVAGRELLPYLWSVRKLIRQLRPDVVHANDPRAALLFGPATRSARIPLVTHVRGQIAVPRSMWAAIERLSDRLVLVSHALRDDLGEHGRAKSVTVYNGTDDIRGHGGRIAWLEHQRRSGHLVVCCFASVVPFKGYHHLADAIAKLNARGWAERATFVGVGDIAEGFADYQQWLAAKIRRLGISNLTFAGWQPDPFAFYRAADLTVLPSVQRETLQLTDSVVEVAGNEGFPRTNLEAMCFGLPIVATNIAGTPEQISDEESGLLVPPADPEALATALETLLTDATKRRQMGEIGRQRALQLFSVDANVSGIMDIYSAVLARE